MEDYTDKQIGPIDQHIGAIEKRNMTKRYTKERQEIILDSIVRETPLTLFINHHEFVTLICSPQNYEVLGVGFLLSEGVIRSFDDIVSLEIDNNAGLLNILIHDDFQKADTFLRRNIASCCGKGRSSLYFINDAKQVRTVQSTTVFDLDGCIRIMQQAEKQAIIFHETGGTHFAALIQNVVLCMFEDIGRHNAVDKVLGWSLVHDVNNTDKCLLLSGRISSEIVIKAARASIPIIISRAAPTDLAINLAEDLGICIIGFARSNILNIYTNKEKVK